MKLTATFKQINEDFSQEDADLYNNGKESESNMMVNWEDEIVLKNDISELVPSDKKSFPLAGTLPNGNSFHYDIPNMKLFEAIGVDGSITLLGCSEVILLNESIDQNAQEIKLTLEFTNNELYSNPIPGMYIVAQDFPEELFKDLGKDEKE